MIKRTALAFAFVLLLSAIGYSYMDLSNASDQGCEDTTGVWRCHIPAPINGSAAFVESVACFSTEADSFDKGCYGGLELTKSVSVSDCTYSVTDDKEFVYNPCEKVSLAKGTAILAMIDPAQLDMTGCDDYQEGTIYVKECPMDGKEVAFEGLIVLGDEESQAVLVTGISKSGFDFMSFLVGNLLYIILIIVIVIVAYWVFMPHKPMFKERKPVKEAPAPKKYQSRREDRYGRKL